MQRSACGHPPQVRPPTSLGTGSERPADRTALPGAHHDHVVVGTWLAIAVVLLVGCVLVGPGWLRLVLSTGAVAVLVRLNVRLDPSLPPTRPRTSRRQNQETA
ncbi:hypothetical protein [Salsipaludibacter albus]|uniref:hypothetical protein n=1 Tax=Salsipaludibacter albus TaxID=2849650 RepID=UPI001EE48FEB|nr:hypothetical protein [Salsipaludibacter albus]MBY5162648.1 hypothetical protein [Salsipaludibacter albus]